jgi:hypothetical protein
MKYGPFAHDMRETKQSDNVASGRQAHYDSMQPNVNQRLLV